MKLKPMLCKVGSPDDVYNKDWIFEQKLDGVRALCFWTSKKCLFISRNDLDVSGYFPECPQKTAISAKSCVLDGEIVAFNTKGVSKFQLLQEGKGRLAYVVFDILEKNGVQLIHKPLHERKKILAYTIKNWRWFRRISHTKNGSGLWKKAQKLGWEGIIAKDNDSEYLSGMRSGSWLKIKQHATVDVVIIGFHSKKRTIGSLAMGLYDCHGKLHYIGKVGTGFTQALLQELEPKLKKLVTKKSPVLETEIPSDITWLRPKLVAEIKYQERTRDGKLRIPALVRFRTDKKAVECTLESQF